MIEECCYEIAPNFVLLGSVENLESLALTLHNKVQQAPTKQPRSINGIASLVAGAGPQFVIWSIHAAY